MYKFDFKRNNPLSAARSGNMRLFRLRNHKAKSASSTINYLRHASTLSAAIAKNMSVIMNQPTELLNKPIEKSDTSFVEKHSHYSFIIVLVLMSLFMIVTISVTGLMLAFCRKKNTVFVETSKSETDSHVELDDVDKSDSEIYMRKNGEFYVHLSDEYDDGEDDDDDRNGRGMFNKEPAKLKRSKTFPQLHKILKRRRFKSVPTNKGVNNHGEFNDTTPLISSMTNSNLHSREHYKNTKKILTGQQFQCEIKKNNGPINCYNKENCKLLLRNDHNILTTPNHATKFHLVRSGDAQLTCYGAGRLHRSHTIHAIPQRGIASRFRSARNEDKVHPSDQKENSKSTPEEEEVDSAHALNNREMKPKMKPFLNSKMTPVINSKMTPFLHNITVPTLVTNCSNNFKTNPQTTNMGIPALSLVKNSHSDLISQMSKGKGSVLQDDDSNYPTTTRPPKQTNNMASSSGEMLVSILSCPATINASIFPETVISSNFQETVSPSSFSATDTTSSFPEKVTTSSFSEVISNFQETVNASSFPEAVTPSSFPETVTPSSFPERATTSSFPERAITSSFPEKVISSNFQETVNASSFPETATTSSFPETATTSSFPERATTSSFPERVTTSSFQETATASSFPEKVISSNFPETATASSFPSIVNISSYPATIITTAIHTTVSASVVSPDTELPVSSNKLPRNKTNLLTASVSTGLASKSSKSLPTSSLCSQSTTAQQKEQPQ